MITKIEHKEIVEVTVPMHELLNSESTWNSVAQMMLIIGSPNYMGVTDKGLAVKIVNVNTIEDDFFRGIISEALSGKEGFSVNWLKGDNQAYIEVEKEKLKDEFDNELKFENNTHYLIPIATYTKGVRSSYTKFEEILNWVEAYAKSDLSNVYSDPLTIAQLRMNYSTQE